MDNYKEIRGVSVPELLHTSLDPLKFAYGPKNTPIEAYFEFVPTVRDFDKPSKTVIHSSIELGFFTAYLDADELLHATLSENLNEDEMSLGMLYQAHGFQNFCVQVPCMNMTIAYENEEHNQLGREHRFAIVYVPVANLKLL